MALLTKSEIDGIGALFEGIAGVRLLIAHISELETRLVGARAALEFYGDSVNYDPLGPVGLNDESPIDEDDGAKARAWLGRDSA